MQIQVSKDHYGFKYLSKKRWISYWHQLNEVLSASPDSVLEIGVGSGLFKQAASCIGLKVETVDIDPELNPDYVASVLSLPFSDNSYDVVVAFQVLEHLPYDKFSVALREMKRVSRRRIIISLPDASVIWRYLFYVPKFGEKAINVKRPQIKKREHVFDGEHYWEISKKDYPLKRITEDIRMQGINLIKTYRVSENVYHRFFVLEANM